MDDRSNEPAMDGKVVTASSYWAPPRFVSSGWIEHAPFASWIVSALRPRTIVELGTHNGYSLLVLAQAAQRFGRDTRIWAVDSWEGDDQAGFYGGEVYESVREAIEGRFDVDVQLVRSYFADAVGRFPDGSVDLLHIDGRHGYDDVREDWQLYLPKLSDRGVALFHDTFEFQPGFGVHRFWDEIADTAPSFRFEHGHGLGVLVVGRNAPSEVLEFIAEGRVDPERVRSAYATLGADLTRRADAEADARRELAEVRHELEAARAEAERLDGVERGLRDQASEILSSTSWRVTAPLRVLGGLVRRRPPSTP